MKLFCILNMHEEILKEQNEYFSLKDNRSLVERIWECKKCGKELGHKIYKKIDAWIEVVK